ncbi:MAG: hypothetical protein ACQEP4_04395 [Bacillota bacterium]
MNDILLVNRINHKDFTSEKQKVFFQIGEIHLPRVETKLMDLIDSSRLIDEKDVLYKYNGFEVDILTQSIPILVKILCENNIPIYGVYAIYNPKL